MDYRRDEYGNPVRDATYEQVGGHTGTIGSGTTVPADIGHGTTGAGGQAQVVHGTEKEGHGISGMLHRSSSSSSSEDDGHGGRRKKGLKQKIKEKLPGGHKEQSHTEYDVTGQPITHTEEKKGIMEKVKEKLPGHHD